MCPLFSPGRLASFGRPPSKLIECPLTGSPSFCPYFSCIDR
jgi:hypothetical protein